MTSQLSRDLTFWAALVGGPFTWGLLALTKETAPALSWPFSSPWSLLLPVVLYPVLEELAFRGWLQGWLWQYAYGRRRVGPVSLANLTTSTLFVGFHLLRQPPVWSLAVMPPSLVFGFFRDRYQRLMPSIILHIFYNSGFIWLFAWPP